MEWISVKDKLPILNTDVLVYCNDSNSICIGELDLPTNRIDGSPDVRLRCLKDKDKLIEGKYFWDNPDWFRISIDITHWMNLPKLPIT